MVGYRHTLTILLGVVLLAGSINCSNDTAQTLNTTVHNGNSTIANWIDNTQEGNNTIQRGNSTIQRGYTYVPVSSMSTGGYVGISIGIMIFLFLLRLLVQCCRVCVQSMEPQVVIHRDIHFIDVANLNPVGPASQVYPPPPPVTCQDLPPPYSPPSKVLL